LFSIHARFQLPYQEGLAPLELHRVFNNLLFFSAPTVPFSVGCSVSFPERNFLVTFCPLITPYSPFSPSDCREDFSLDVQDSPNPLGFLLQFRTVFLSFSHRFFFFFLFPQNLDTPSV